MISRTNNFDFMRLLFAALVVISHSYVLSGTGQYEPFSKITLHRIELSYLGVHGFFIISGYLIFKSLLRCKGLVDFYWKRILRLFPALTVILIFTVLLAPAVYENNIPYYKNSDVYSYIPLNMTLFFRQKGIDGVFESNPYKHSINGSLWTISYEFSMYVMVSALYFIRKKTYLKYIVLLLFLLSYSLSIFQPYFLNGLFAKIALSSKHFYNLMCFFTGGMFITYLDIKNKRRENIIIILSTIIFSAGIYLDITVYTSYLTLPLIVIFLGRRSTPLINKVGQTIGDTSYGIYIYSFPVQQTLVHLYRSDAITLLIFSLPISIILGYISWHLIEKRALKYKDLFVRKSIL
ncbi:acyltransferase family protein [Chryseobacterium salviniae]|uniref:Acyltransferase n=1 Tax=Chryseobacterium salviniae TaxID=3101750 RepID=A0ABU6HTQ8_9FLAO|nr:acyltransferase [Chryseobacterium sp. T9W2-O]MEC3876104.1 acyltransferase [Chryseobacterium sp. T9W2-O]